MKKYITFEIECTARWVILVFLLINYISLGLYFFLKGGIGV